MTKKPVKNNARVQAYDYLARREHTRAELMNKLLRKGYRREVIEQALEDLTREGAISHVRFVEDYIENRARKGYGPNRIRAELAHKGIDQTDIDEGLQTADIDWLEQTRLCYERKYKGVKMTDMKEKLKRKRYLYQRGYPQEYIREVME